MLCGRRGGLQGDPGAAEVRTRWVPLHGKAALPHAVPGTHFLGRARSWGSVTFLQPLANRNGPSPNCFPPWGGCSNGAIDQTNQPPPKKPNPKVRLLQLSSGWQMAHLKAVQMSNFEVMVLAAEPAPSDGLYVFCPGVVQMRIKDMSLLNEGVIASNGRTFKNLIENN